MSQAALPPALPPVAAVSRETNPDAPVASGEVLPRPARRRVVAVVNQKGGVGKTTTLVNLAAALALGGATVLCCDLDPQGNASTALGIPHESGTPSLYDVLLDGRPLAEVAVLSPIAGLWCAPATIDLAGGEVELAAVTDREHQLARALAGFDPAADYVFLDCPPSLGLLTVNALSAAAEVWVPIQCEYYALEGLGQLLRTIERVRAHLNPDLRLTGVLLTMYDSRTRLAEQVAAEVRTHFGALVVDPPIPRSVRVAEAPGYGQSVLTYDPQSSGAQAYRAAARTLAHRGATR